MYIMLLINKQTNRQLRLLVISLFAAPSGAGVIRLEDELRTVQIMYHWGRVITLISVLLTLLSVILSFLGLIFAAVT